MAKEGKEENQETDENMKGREVEDLTQEDNKATTTIKEATVEDLVLKAEEENDDTFKKPVFISKVQKKVESCNSEDVENSKDSSSETETKSASSSPAQQLIEKSVPLPYKEPEWSGLPAPDYSFEVLKNGTIVEEIPLTRPFTIMGRLQQCHVFMQHPSLSRYHCIVQYRSEGSPEQPQGFYAYDLGSTHGSYHNKHRMKPHTYYRLRVGHMLKLAGSSRSLILQGPDEDQEEETAESARELMAAAAARKLKLDRLETGEMEEEDQDCKKQDNDKNNTTSGGTSTDGIDWGMGEDAQEEGDEEEEDRTENPFAKMNEEIYVADPKKTLRGWLEREGYDLPEYSTEDLGRGTFSCSVQLPVPGPGGGPLVARAEHKGRKKDAVVLCAREACRLLDKMGVLRQATHESLERRRKDWAENDYYDSDEDDFLDRTGDIQRKRLKRMEQAKDNSTETYDSLRRKYDAVIEELTDLDGRLAAADVAKTTIKGSTTITAEDDLDSYMSKLKAGVPDKHKRVTWKLRAIQLRKDELKLRRLTNVARPFGVSEIRPYLRQNDNDGTKLPSNCSTSAGPQRLSTKLSSTLTQPKEPIYQVHKIFLEEEPEPKLKLRRLDDDDSDLPKPQPYWKKDAPNKRPAKRSVNLPSKPSEIVTSRSTTDIKLEPSLPPTFNVPLPPSLAVSGSENVMKKEASESLGDDKDSLTGNCRAIEKPLSKDSRTPSVKNYVKEENVNTGSEVFVKCESKSGESKGNNRVLQEKERPEINNKITESTDNNKLHEGDHGDTEDNGKVSEPHSTLGRGKMEDITTDCAATEEKKAPSELKRAAPSKDITKEASSPDKRSRLLAPTLPPHIAQLRSGGPQEFSRSKKKKVEKHRMKYDEDDPNYDTWVPPSQQSGDGRTSLNQKFGY